MAHFHMSAETTSTLVGFSTAFKIIALSAAILAASKINLLLTTLCELPMGGIGDGISLGGNRDVMLNLGRDILLSPLEREAQLLRKTLIEEPSRSLCDIHTPTVIPPQEKMFT
ncbi:hypothetical protein FRX31_023047 [Thalictrum thalictroides]|uniref:Uncharacterized protein n=1 Tax=Thalictrum thalictroides TaxID=46969 RepID=A0A7J6VT18_THATH|nr:hypothetical protein FRX31_023047 [Thalictrum thalictroides]